MEEIFKINVNDEPVDVRALGITPEQIQFEICKNGQVEFTIEHQINTDGNEVWELVDNGKGKANDVSQDLIDSIGEKIDAYYM